MPEKTHFKKLTNPNYMGDYSIPEGSDLIATIDFVRKEKVTGVGGKTEEEVVAHFSDGNKPLILNKTNMKTIAKIYKTPYIEDWRGRSIQIYYDPTVKFGRETVGGLRIRAQIPAQKQVSLKCADCGGTIAPAFGKTAEYLSMYTHKTYGKELCADCATKEKAKLDAQKAPDPFNNNQEESI
jgi:hypothetical protein